MDQIEGLVKAFLQNLEKGADVEKEVIVLRNKKFSLLKDAGKGKGLFKLASELDSTSKGEVLMDKKNDLKEIMSILDSIKKINEALIKLFERELKFGAEEIDELKKASVAIDSDIKSLQEYYSKSKGRVSLSLKDQELLAKTGNLGKEEQEEERKILVAINAINVIDDFLNKFRVFLINQLKHIQISLGEAYKIWDPLTKGKKENPADITEIKNGIRDLLLEFRSELEYFEKLAANEAASKKIFGEIKKAEEVREATKVQIAKVAKRDKLRVLIVPCNWGFGPVSNAVSIANSLKNIDSVLEDVAVIAAEEICSAAKKGFSKIKTYKLDDSQLYDRTVGLKSEEVQRRAINFIEILEKKIEEFKPNLVIDSFGYIATTIAKAHDIPVIKIDHLFPELTRGVNDQNKGIDLFKKFEDLKSTKRATDIRTDLIRSLNLRSLEWLGDVLADYLIVPSFYNIDVTPSVLTYRKNKNILFVNPSMNRQSRILMDDIFGVKKGIEKILSRIRGRKDKFTKTILINTAGGFYGEQYNLEMWQTYVDEITILAINSVELNKRYVKEGKKEFLGIVVIGSLSTSKRFHNYIAEKWTKEMKDCLILANNLRFNNVIRLYISADIILTSPGPTSICELLVLNRPFLLLQPIQSEMARNFKYCLDSGIGLSSTVLRSSDKDRILKGPQQQVLVDLLDQNSNICRDIRQKQIQVASQLKELNGTLAKIVSEILGFEVKARPIDIEIDENVQEIPEYLKSWNKKFSVVIPIMDKPSDFLDNCIYCIRKSEPSKEKAEIIVVDFESKERNFLEYKGVCDKYDAQIHRIDKRGRLFNLSLLRNYGARKASGDYIIFCDVDTLIPQNTFNRLKQILTKNSNAFIIGRVFIDFKKRPKDFYKSLNNEDFHRLVTSEETVTVEGKDRTKRFRFGSRGYGGFIVADREWFYRSRGFDEAYVYWGAEDFDFWFRTVFLEKKELVYLDHLGHIDPIEFKQKKLWYVDNLLPSDVVMIHQYHPPAYENTDPRIQKILEYKEARKQSIGIRRQKYVNSENWGTNKIKVLRMIPVLTFGGMEMTAMVQCEVLAKNGFDVTLLATMPIYEKDFVDRMQKAGVRVLVTDVQLDREKSRKWCEEVIIDFKPEIIFISSLPSLEDKVRELKEVFKEIKIVYRITSSHDAAVSIASRYHWVDLMIVLYQSLIGELKQKIQNFRPEKTVILGNAIEEKWFKVTPSQNNTICMVSRVSPEKCMVSFVKIIDKVKETIPDVRGLIIGGPNAKVAGATEAYEKLTRKIRETNAPITITGYVNDVEKYLSKSKVFLMTSSVEGFPSAVWQGIAAGLIPVTTPVGNLSEALANKKFAYLSSKKFESNSVNQLPGEVEEELAFYCIEALKSNPNVNAIKQMAMPYRIDIWSERFLQIMFGLVGITKEISVKIPQAQLIEPVRPTLAPVKKPKEPSITITHPNNHQILNRNETVEFTAQIKDLDIPESGYKYRWFGINPKTGMESVMGGTYISSGENKITTRINLRYIDPVEWDFELRVLDVSAENFQGDLVSNKIRIIIRIVLE